VTSHELPIGDSKIDQLDLSILDRYLKLKIPTLKGSLSVNRFPNGRSNLTYHICYPGRSLVLRRPPSGTKPKSGHSMAREYKMMTSVRAEFPYVPEVFHYCGDESIIGSEFYVMDFIEGLLVADIVETGWSYRESESANLCTDFWDKLITLHEIDFKKSNLAEMGRPQGYVSRQVHGWIRRFDLARTPDIAPQTRIAKWLELHAPAHESGASILHGDYHMHNILLDRLNKSNIRAVIDWELSTIGDPLMDLGAALAYWTDESDPDYIKSLASQPSMERGMLRRSDVLTYYMDKTHRNTFDFHFYLMFGRFRLIAILQQIYFRLYHRETTGDAANLKVRIDSLCRLCTDELN
jgi:aminoglycoside phosphotransferase (APT) family kinase protein